VIKQEAKKRKRRESKTNVVNSREARSFGNAKLLDQLINPEGHGDDFAIKSLPIDSPEIQIPDSSDFDAIRVIKTINL
jgi:hypothetical protein